METGKTSNRVVYAGIFTAIAASICCITPVLALIAGTSGIVSTFSWVEPYRPYLIGLTIVVLVFAWYQKLRPKAQEEIDCACEDDAKPSFWQSKSFLFIITVFAGLMLTFPSYSHIFYFSSDSRKEILYTDQSNVKEIRVTIEGMTCEGCEAHIESEVSNLDGILHVKADYESANTIVKYDETKVNLEEIETAILSSGYKIIK